MKKKYILYGAIILIIFSVFIIYEKRKFKDQISGGELTYLYYVEGDVEEIDLENSTITVLIDESKEFYKEFYEESRVELDCSQSVYKESLRDLNIGIRIRFGFFKNTPYSIYKYSIVD